MSTVCLLILPLPQEAVEAYKRQNQFLSSEILELNSLRAEDLEAYKVLSK